MAGLDIDPLSTRPVPHDGQAHCRLCATVDPHAGHDWCPAVSGLVCDSCCHRVLLGDMGRLALAALDPTDDGEGAGQCAGCERGQQWFAIHVLGHVPRGTLPS